MDEIHAGTGHAAAGAFFAEEDHGGAKRGPVVEKIFGQKQQNDGNAHPKKHAQQQNVGFTHG